MFEFYEGEPKIEGTLLASFSFDSEGNLSSCANTNSQNLTVRILSKIKAIHSDDNVYLNTIVDEAIRYYYESLKNSIKWITNKEPLYPMLYFSKIIFYHR